MRAILFAVTLLVSFARGNPSSQPSRLDAIVQSAARETLDKFKDKKLVESELAITVIDLRDPATSVTGSFRGNQRIYPASVVKLFYLVATHQWLEGGKLPDTPELRTELRKMIVNSSNQSTGYVLDALTGTTSGDELPEAELKKWSEKRNAVNRYFAALGYDNINVNQKTWDDRPFGRDRQFLGEKLTNRNMLTTDATARLMASIATGKAVTPERSKQMMELLHRRLDPDPKKNSQATGFTGRALSPSDKLWSKAGWTSTTRHDAAYVETADGLKLVIVVFTTNHANEREIIPTAVRSILRETRDTPSVEPE